MVSVQLTFSSLALISLTLTASPLLGTPQCSGPLPAPRQHPRPHTYSSWCCHGRAAATPALCPPARPRSCWARARARAAQPPSAAGSAAGRSPRCSPGKRAKKSTVSTRRTGKAASSRRGWASCWQGRRKGVSWRSEAFHKESSSWPQM